jgi:hypothetical protein
VPIVAYDQWSIFSASYCLAQDLSQSVCESAHETMSKAPGLVRNAARGSLRDRDPKEQLEAPLRA